MAFNGLKYLKWNLETIPKTRHFDPFKLIIMQIDYDVLIPDYGVIN